MGVTGDWSYGDREAEESRLSYGKATMGPGAEYRIRKGAPPPKPKPSRLKRLMEKEGLERTKLRLSGSILGRKCSLSVLTLFNFVRTVLGRAEGSCVT